MILTCPQCQSQYNVDAAQIGAAGRTVRCAGCGHSWFQAAEKSAAEAISTLLQADDKTLAAAVAAQAQQARGKSPAARPDPSLPVVTHNPLGVGATAFGALTFLLCVSVTLLGAFVLKDPVVRRWPAASLLYRTIGVEVPAPGEGLRFSELKAERKAGDEGRALVVSGKITNMTEGDIDYPAIYATIRDEKGAVVRQWTLKPSLDRLSAGEVSPLKLQLNDAPDGATIEMRVKGDEGS